MAEGARPGRGVLPAWVGWCTAVELFAAFLAAGWRPVNQHLSCEGKSAESKNNKRATAVWGRRQDWIDVVKQPDGSLRYRDKREAQGAPGASARRRASPLCQGRRLRPVMPCLRRLLPGWGRAALRRRGAQARRYRCCCPSGAPPRLHPRRFRSCCRSGGGFSRALAEILSCHLPRCRWGGGKPRLPLPLRRRTTLPPPPPPPPPRGYASGKLLARGAPKEPCLVVAPRPCSRPAALLGARVRCLLARLPRRRRAKMRGGR